MFLALLGPSFDDSFTGSMTAKQRKNCLNLYTLTGSMQQVTVLQAASVPLAFFGVTAANVSTVTFKEGALIGMYSSNLSGEF